MATFDLHYGILGDLTAGIKYAQGCTQCNDEVQQKDTMCLGN